MICMGYKPMGEVIAEAIEGTTGLTQRPYLPVLSKLFLAFESCDIALEQIGKNITTIRQYWECVRQLQQLDQYVQGFGHPDYSQLDSIGGVFEVSQSIIRRIRSGCVDLLSAVPVTMDLAKARHHIDVATENVGRYEQYVAEKRPILKQAENRIWAMSQVLRSIPHEY